MRSAAAAVDGLLVMESQLMSLFIAISTASTEPRGTVARVREGVDTDGAAVGTTAAEGTVDNDADDVDNDDSFDCSDRSSLS